MIQKDTMAEIVGTAIGKYVPEEQRLVAALAERIAASRYRAWAETIGDEDHRSTLQRCAEREEEIAQRVESLHPNAPALREQMPKDNPDLHHPHPDPLAWSPWPIKQPGSPGACSATSVFTNRCPPDQMG